MEPTHIVRNESSTYNDQSTIFFAQIIIFFAQKINEGFALAMDLISGLVDTDLPKVYHDSDITSWT
jgi:hypothetical protein